MGATLAELEMNKAALRLPTYPRYDLLLLLDPTLVEELSVMQAEFDFRCGRRANRQRVPPAPPVRDGDVAGELCRGQA